VFHAGNGQWHLTVLAMDNNKTTGHGCLMDAAIDYGKEVAWQQQGRSHLTVAAAAGD
jgi:hypothetical protein